MQSVFKCPQTNVHVAFELPVDPEDRERHWFTPLTLACPACNSLHEADYQTAFKVGVMSEFTCLPADIQDAGLQ